MATRGEVRRAWARYADDGEMKDPAVEFDTWLQVERTEAIQEYRQVMEVPWASPVDPAPFLVRALNWASIDAAARTPDWVLADRLKGCPYIDLLMRRVVEEYVRTKEVPTIRVENPEDVMPLLRSAKADAWDECNREAGYPFDSTGNPYRDSEERS